MSRLERCPQFRGVRVPLFLPPLPLPSTSPLLTSPPLPSPPFPPSLPPYLPLLPSPHSLSLPPSLPPLPLSSSPPHLGLPGVQLQGYLLQLNDRVLLCSAQYRQQIIDTIAHSHTHLRTLVGSLRTLVESGVEPEGGGVPLCTTEYHWGPVLPLAYLLDPGPELVSLEEKDEHYLVHHLTLEERGKNDPHTL